MSDGFEAWFNRLLEESPEKYEYYDDFQLKNICEYLWDYQQKKIDKLVSALEEYCKVRYDDRGKQYSGYWVSHADDYSEQISWILEDDGSLARKVLKELKENRK